MSPRLPARGRSPWRPDIVFFAVLLGFCLLTAVTQAVNCFPFKALRQLSCVYVSLQIEVALDRYTLPYMPFLAMMAGTAAQLAAWAGRPAIGDRRTARTGEHLRNARTLMPARGIRIMPLE